MDDAQVLWDYHQMHHEPRNTDIAIGLGSHDIGVAEHTADLYRQGRFPLIVFTGANAPTTVEVFPRGEAVHYAERAEQLGVPDTAIVLEEHARNTGENFTRLGRCSTARASTRSPQPSSAGPTNNVAPTRPARSSGLSSR
ncbi:YdcF family protein [Pedococcus sp. 5OH_020]|uniref:YdcF family protein n=1 Tax=Pedococcus sp. 5OH_020 TaxID=2989814 RepID=UPI0022E9C6B0|nr:YdcF family protein [Pedococcus sp. 5OH_020]